MKFTLRFFPARYGDSIIIEYGGEGAEKYILIDGGTGGTRKELMAFISMIPKERCKVEVMIVTHIDKDHIEGILRMMEAKKLRFQVDDFWFNGYHHLSPRPNGEEGYGSRQGEFLTNEIIKHKLKWNGVVDGSSLYVPDEGDLPVFELNGGLKMTLLSPSLQHLRELKPVWEKELERLKLKPGFGYIEDEHTRNENEQAYGERFDVDALNNLPFNEDHAEANASSLAFLVEFEGKRVLILGDAQPSQVFRSLRRFQTEGKIKVDLCKISHHGSRGNTSPELLELLDCPKFVISTNGSIYGHPHTDTIARIIKRSSPGAVIYFNYRTKHNKIWEDEVLCFKHDYNTMYGEKGSLEIYL